MEANDRRDRADHVACRGEGTCVASMNVPRVIPACPSILLRILRIAEESSTIITSTVISTDHKSVIGYSLVSFDLYAMSRTE